ncbi:MAG: PAS domain-containing protein [Sphingomonadales bacterium]|nr:PAS domain-containing protein [Sphingomonadales bacterium]
MASKDLSLTGHERTFHPDEFIVSKTDLTGRITYANDVFLRVAGYTEGELLGEQHSIIRHPHMPRAAFKLMWDEISAGHEFFAYVINRAKNGDHYWVLAHVTPTYDADGNIISYHSSRRIARPEAVAAISPIYEKLVSIENAGQDRKLGMQNSFQALVDLLSENNVTYEEFVLSI